MKTFECGHCGGLNDVTKLIDDVAEFHVKFDRSYSGPVRDLPKEERKFRDVTIDEELEEFKQARLEFLAAKRDGSAVRMQAAMAKMLDARIDLIYFILGEIVLMGFAEPHTSTGQVADNVSLFVTAWKRVHDANMAKVLSSDENPSKRGPQFNGIDIVKPEGWQPPDLTDLCQFDQKEVK